MSIEQNKEIARRASEEIFSNPSPELVAELYAPDARVHRGNQTLDFDQVTREVIDGATRKAFPDFRVTVEAIVAEGDLVVVRERATGTHQGEYRTPLGVFPATGKRVEATGTVTRRIRDGKIVESWVNRDGLALLQQIGALPAPAVPA